MITGENPKEENSFLQQLNLRLEQGISLIQLRAHTLSDFEFVELTKKVLPLCHQYHAKVLLNRNPNLVRELNVDGIHLNSKTLLTCRERPLDENKLVAASCHNKEELLHAEKIGVDFVTLSPVVPTKSHPGEPHLGWVKFAELASLVKIPVFALGGLGVTDREIAKGFGAYGIAAINAIWFCHTREGGNLF